MLVRHPPAPTVPENPRPGAVPDAVFRLAYDRAMSRVEIEYCTQCRWLSRAAWLAQELLSTFETELAEVALKPGTGGVFVVRVDGQVVWDRREQGFPEPTAVKRAVRDLAAPGKSLGHSDRAEP